MRTYKIILMPKFPGDVPVSKLLRHLLEATGQAKFRIEKEAIIVTK